MSDSKAIKFNTVSKGGKGSPLQSSQRDMLVVNLPVHTPDGEPRFVKAALAVEGLTAIELDDEYSALITPQGMQIPVQMSHESLTDILCSTVGKKDMTLVTGPMVYKLAPHVELMSSSDFVRNFERQDKPQKIENKPVEVHLFAFAEERPEQRVVCSFLTSDVEWNWGDHSRSKKGWGYLKLKNKRVTTHQGFWFDMPKEKFMERLNLAQMKGVSVLDLREETRLKTKAPPKPAIKGL